MLEDYNLIWSDHPSNTKRGGVCIYYKESFSVSLVDITSLPECLVCEVTIQNKKNFFLVQHHISFNDKTSDNVKAKDADDVELVLL